MAKKRFDVLRYLERKNKHSDYIALHSNQDVNWEAIPISQRSIKLNRGVWYMLTPGQRKDLFSKYETILIKNCKKKKGDT